MRFTGGFCAVICSGMFVGCQDREIEPIGSNVWPYGSPREASIVPITKSSDSAKSFVGPTAPVLKNVIGRARWAMQDDTPEQPKLEVRRMQVNTFKSRCPKSVYSRSIFSINKQLEFGNECINELDNASITSYTSTTAPERTIVTVRGCLSVNPKGFAFFEMNLIAGPQDLVKYINERPPKHGQCKRVFDSDRWVSDSKKDEKKLVVKVEPKSGKFPKKLSTILRPFFEKEGILHKQKVSAMMFRLLRSDTQPDGQVVMNKAQSVPPLILYVSTPNQETP